MKVLLTATVQSHIYQFHKPLVEVLHKNGYEVHAAARNNLAEKNGLVLDFVDQVFDVPFSRSPKSVDNVKAYMELKRIIDREHYDIIHCNTPMGGVVTRLAARKSRMHGTKVYYTAHGFHFYKGAPKKNWLVYYPIEKYMSRLTDCLITVTKEDYALASQKFNCPVEHIHGVGLNTKKFDSVTPAQAAWFRKEQGWDGDFLILCTGELNANKNQSTIIRAMPLITRKIPNARLLLAGNGPHRDMLQSLITELHMEDAVSLLGYRTDLEWFVHACDAVASASFREGLPVNMLEAMYCGKVVVGSNNRGHRELLEDGKSGYLVDASSAEQFADRLVKLAKSRDLSNELGMAGKNKVAEYTDSTVKKELAIIYGLKM